MGRVEGRVDVAVAGARRGTGKKQESEWQRGRASASKRGVGTGAWRRVRGSSRRGGAGEMEA